MTVKSEQEITTVHLHDGRTLHGRRNYFVIERNLIYETVGPPTPWEFTLDGKSITAEEATALLHEEFGPSEAA